MKKLSSRETAQETVQEITIEGTPEVKPNKESDVTNVTDLVIFLETAPSKVEMREVRAETEAIEETEEIEETEVIEVTEAALSSVITAVNKVTSQRTVPFKKIEKLIKKLYFYVLVRLLILGREIVMVYLILLIIMSG